MIQNIIVEGIDCAGKSTLVKELKNSLGWDSKSLQHKKTSQFRRYLYEYAINQETIFERSHISEEVYSQLFKRDKPFTARQKDILESICNEFSLIILALPENSVAIERYQARHFEKQVVDEAIICRGNAMFGQIGKKFSNVLVYKSADYEELSRLVKKVIKIVHDSYRA